MSCANQRMYEKIRSTIKKDHRQNNHNEIPMNNESSMVMDGNADKMPMNKGTCMVNANDGRMPLNGICMVNNGICRQNAGKY